MSRPGCYANLRARIRRLPPNYELFETIVFLSKKRRS